MRQRVISVSQVVVINPNLEGIWTANPIIIFLLADGTEISQADDDGARWVNREYYIGKEASEVDGSWIVHN